MTIHEMNLEQAAQRLSVTAMKACKRCKPFAGETFATIARKHIAQPKLVTRGALMSMCLVTKADAVAAVDLAAELEGDGELTDHLLASLRGFLEVA